MATSLETPSPVHLKQNGARVMASSPLFSPSSDKRFWSTLQSRIDALLEDRHREVSKGDELPSVDTFTCTNMNERSQRLREDSLLLIRGFDTVAHTLSLLTNNLDNALQGARELAHPPTLTDMIHNNLNEAKSKEEGTEEQAKEKSKKGIKRTCDHKDFSDEQRIKDRHQTKAKNLAFSMATKAGSLARELKSIKSDLCFMQERCGLLEGENRRLRDGLAKGIRPEEDDLVRLQLEALLAEKSRLANENASLIRENQCLHQLVEYHQLTSQDLSESYEQVIQGLCLDFSSPPPAEAGKARDEDSDRDNDRHKALQMLSCDLYELSSSLDRCYHGVEYN